MIHKLYMIQAIAFRGKRVILRVKVHMNRKGERTCLHKTMLCCYLHTSFSRPMVKSRFCSSMRIFQYNVILLFHQTYLTQYIYSHVRIKYPLQCTFHHRVYQYQAINQPNQIEHAQNKSIIKERFQSQQSSKADFQIGIW